MTRRNRNSTRYLGRLTQADLDRAADKIDPTWAPPTGQPRTDIPAPTI